MRSSSGLAILLCAVSVSWSSRVPASAQDASPSAPTPARLPQTAPAKLTCPSPLGTGVKTKVAFCEVVTGGNPADGILIRLPPHEGDVRLRFDLHNRHAYSEAEVKTGQGYRRYTATVGVLAMDNTLVDRAVVQSEFRTASDLLDRIGGGVGPGGLKAVAPTGTESIVIVIPARENQVSVLGEKLAVEQADGSVTYTAPGRPIADISRVMVEFTAPARPVPTVRARTAVKPKPTLVAKPRKKPQTKP